MQGACDEDKKFSGEPGRSLRLEIEGSGGGEWLIPLDSPAAKGSAEHEVAHVALDGAEFCRLIGLISWPFAGSCERCIDVRL